MMRGFDRVIRMSSIGQALGNSRSFDRLAQASRKPLCRAMRQENRAFGARVCITRRARRVSGQGDGWP